MCFILYPGKGIIPVIMIIENVPYIESKGQRGIRWVKPYYDINGLGLVLPCTVSLYHNDAFRGVLALDLTLDFAKKLMFAKDESSASFLKESFILNSHGEIIVSSSMLVNNEKSRKINNQAIEPKLHPQKVLTSAIEKGHDSVFSVAENNVKYVYAVNKISL